jgi:branched-chain amino acid transport system permease protein
LSDSLQKVEAFQKARGKKNLALLILVASSICVLPLLVNDYVMSVAVIVILNAITVLGLNLVMGYAGQISLGHAAFCGLGAYFSGILSTQIGLPPVLTIVIAATVSGMIAYLVGIPTFKLKGHYLAMATLALGIIIYEIFKQEIYLTGGPTGYPSFSTKGKIPYIELFGFVFDTNTRIFLLAGFVLFVAMILSLNIVNSRVGRALRSIHDDDIAAGSLGVNYAKFKVRVFVLSAVFASISGSLYAHYILHITPSAFGFHISVELVAMVVIGGRGSIFGSLLGAALLTALPEALHVVQEYDIVVFGLIMVLVMMFMPGGLAQWFDGLYTLALRLISKSKKEVAEVAK